MILRHFLTILSIIFMYICACNNSGVKNLRNHVEYLASDNLQGRLPTTKGDSLAQLYIQTFYSMIGLESIDSKYGYLQPFPYLADIKVAPSNQIAISISNKEWKLAHEKDYVFYHHSNSADVESELVFIGYGIQNSEIGYDDFNKVNLKNKIAICYRVLPPEAPEILKRWWLQNRVKHQESYLASLGCLGLIYVYPKAIKNHDELKPIRMNNYFSQRTQQKQIPIVQMSNSAFAKLLSKIGKNIEQIDKQLNTSTSSMAFIFPETKLAINVQIDYIYRNAANIIGFLKGKDTTQSIIIGAHYDHIGIDYNHAGIDSICNGADDNASGVAAILELAKFSYKKRDFDCNLVFVAFSAEESGFVGSSYFLRNLPSEIGEIKAMLNFDMVGRMRDDTLFIRHTDSANEWSEYLANIQTNNLSLIFDKKKGASDEGVFLEQGIPSLWFYTGNHKDVHKVTDEAILINYGGINRVVRYVFEILEQISKKENALNFSS